MVRAWLKKLREAAGVSQSLVDRGMASSRGYWRRVEAGLVPLPSKEGCDAFQHATGSNADVWGRVAPERLADFDPDLWAWHQAQVTAASADSLTWGQRWLLSEVEDSAWTPEQLAGILERVTSCGLTPHEMNSAIDAVQELAGAASRAAHGARWLSVLSGR